MNQITVHNRKFDTWKGFREAVSASNAKGSIFRGQRDPKWKLASLWERQVASWALPNRLGRNISDSFYKNGYSANRDVFLARFKEQMERLHGQTENMTKEQWWGIGRHYGLVTPLLDWTYNPLVAAYFAMVDWCRWVCADELDEKEEERRRTTCPYIAVWRLTRAEGLFREQEFEIVGPENPPEFAERIKAQEGAFTKLTSEHLFDVGSYLASREMTSTLECTQLLSKTISEALAALHDDGIHHAALFPDLHGAAEYANLREYIKPQSFDETTKVVELLNNSFRSRGNFQA